MIEKQIKDFDERISNLALVISEGKANQVLFDKLNQFEEEKKIAQENLEREKKGINHIFATRQELKQAYEKAKQVLENGDFHEKKTMLANFINKIFVYKDRVEIYLNLVPMMLCGYLDMEINNQEVITLNNFVQKEKIVEDEKGIYNSVPVFGESKEKYQEGNQKEGQEGNKKEQPIQSSVVPFPATNNIYGDELVWLPLLDSNQRPIG